MADGGHFKGILNSSEYLPMIRNDRPTPVSDFGSTEHPKADSPEADAKTRISVQVVYLGGDARKQEPGKEVRKRDRKEKDDNTGWVLSRQSL